MASFDFIVIGVGSMGAATCDALARRGHRVLGLEQFDLGHDRGSAHGRTRIIRKAYFEHPDYVPLLEHAYSAWGELEDAGDARLMLKCGVLIAGPPLGEVMQGVKNSADQHALSVDAMDAAATHARFGGLRIPDHYVAMFEADAGALRVENCVTELCARAVRHGADLRTWEPVVSFEQGDHGAVVTTPLATYEAAGAIVCGGAWCGRLLKGLRIPLQLRRKMQLWVSAAEAQSIERGWPAFGIEHDDGHFDYALPDLGDGLLKVGRHTGGELVDDPKRIDRSLRPTDETELRGFIEQNLPGADTRIKQHSACVYAMTPDQHFIVDRHPHMPSISLATGFSGHGFKFAPVIGAALADLATEGQTALPIEFLRISRFEAAP